MDWRLAMRPRVRLPRGVLPMLAAAALALGGCASTPQATAERDAEAKQFISRPDAATIYVYRDDFSVENYDMQDTTLYVNDRVIGATLPKTFFRFDVRAGEHLLRGYGYDQGRLKVVVQSGEIAFIRLNVANGNSRFTRVSPEIGKREIVRCCALMENWAPEQRPLLR
jgi:hypothetical protein